ncbi:MAG TPA: response regulator [Noviherbaspirillum sp.]
MRFRNQLLILVLSILIPAFLAAILAVWYVYGEERRAQENGVLEATRAFSLLVGQELQTKEAILKTLSNSAALAKGDLQEFYSIAKRMAPTSETTIILIDHSGRQLINTRAAFGTQLPHRRAPRVLELMEHYGAERTLVSDVFLAPVGKQYDFTVQVPVMLEGSLRYFLVMGVNAASLQPLLHQQRLPRDWLGVILDRQGVVVSRSRNPGQYIGKQSSEEFRRQISAGTEGVFRSTTLDEVSVKTFFSRVAFSDWTVIFSIPESELRRVPLQAAAFLALMMALLLGLAFLIAQRIALRLSARVEQLGAAADQLARGEDVSYLPQGLVEVDSVGARIVDSSRQIRRNKQELEQRVAQAVAETERAQQALQHNQKLEALGRLTGGIAHEFNNLLQTLTTSLQLARMSSTEPRVQSLIDTCNKAVTRATSLTGQLSAFGRIQDARTETVALARHVRVFEQLVENILPSNMPLQVDLPDDLWPVTLDPTQLELALINLAINSRDAMPAGGSIRVEAANETLAAPPEGLSPGDYVRLRLRDTGMGMSAEVMAKALDPFFTTKKVGQGTGLGLPQAYGFARQSGGTLVLHSVVGEGTTVDIYLPRATQAVSRTPEKTGAQQFAPSVKGTVLFVEDDALVRESVSAALREAGFAVLAAEGADAALAMLDAGASVDVLFSDIVMPGSLNGIELANTMRVRFPQVKVVLATGYSEHRVQLAGVRVLAKPYEIDAAVRELVEAAAG